MTLRSGNKYARSKASDFMDDENSDDEEDTFVEDTDLPPSTNPEQVTFLEIRESQSQKYDDPEAERTQVVTKVTNTEDGGVVQEILSDSETESDVAEDTHYPSRACETDVSKNTSYPCGVCKLEVNGKP